MQEQEMAERNLILKVRVGSHMYGTNTPESDEDIVGVCIPDIDYVIGLKRFEQYEHHTNKSGNKKNTKDDKDITIYSLTKFIHLLIGNNPNIIEIPFSPPNCILYMNEYGKKLMDSFPLFVSQKSYYTFSGYAHTQERFLMNKNPTGDRKILIDKYGFDTKFAYHLIRVYYEGIELLNSGKITLPHVQRGRLVDIKTGKVPLAEVLADAKRLK
jgi:predicted nucleotidyltransferase